MEQHYFSIGHLNIGDEELFFKKIIGYFGQRSIFAESKNLNDKSFITTYQNCKFEVSLRYFKKTGYAIKTDAIDKSSSNLSYVGFIVLLKDFLVYHYGLKHYEIEGFFEKNILHLNETDCPRFISRKSICLFLENFKLDTSIPIEVETFGNNSPKINYAGIELKSVACDEEACVLMWRKFDYDDGDIANAEFLPLTIAEFEMETTEFPVYFLVDINDYNFYSLDEIRFILRLEKESYRNAYLLKTNTHLKFFEVLFDYG